MFSLRSQVRKKRLHVNPESLVPKLPKPQDLQPFPTTLAVRYTGHRGKVSVRLSCVFQTSVRSAQCAVHSAQCAHQAGSAFSVSTRHRDKAAAAASIRYATLPSTHL